MHDPDRIYVRFRGRTLGPFTMAKTRELVQRGKITRMHELSADGRTWCKAEDFGDLFGPAQLEPLAVLEAAYTEASKTSPTHGLAAGIERSASASRVNPNTPVEPSVQWYASVNSESQGPVAFSIIRQWVASGVVDSQTLVWRAGLDNWQAAGEAIPELFTHVAQNAAPSRQAAAAHNQPQAVDNRHDAARSRDLGVELSRCRGWATFAAILTIIFAALQVVAKLISFALEANDPEAEGASVGRLLSTIGVLAWSGTLVAAAVLLLRYCDALQSFSRSQAGSYTLLAAKRLSTFWLFVGIASSVWLLVAFLAVLLTISFMIAAA